MFILEHILMQIKLRWRNDIRKTWSFVPHKIRNKVVAKGPCRKNKEQSLTCCYQTYSVHKMENLFLLDLFKINLYKTNTEGVVMRILRKVLWTYTGQVLSGTVTFLILHRHVFLSKLKKFYSNKVSFCGLIKKGSN